MKTFVCLAFLACVLACVLACDPDSNNQPECTSSNVNVPVRNYWDPSAYWLCSSAGAEAELVRCPDANLFHSDLGQCVLWNEWVWSNPCPDN